MAVRPRIPYTAPLIDPKTSTVTLPWSGFFTNLVNQQPPPNAIPWQGSDGSTLVLTTNVLNTDTLHAENLTANTLTANVGVFNNSLSTNTFNANTATISGLLKADSAIFTGNSAITLPSGTTAQRPALANARMLRYNSELDQIELYRPVDNSWHENAWVGQVVVENGFVDTNPATTSKITIDNALRTFSIEPVGANYVIWAGGKEYVKTAKESVTFDATEGFKYFYFDDAGVLTFSATYSVDTSVRLCVISVTYWDSVINKMLYVANERHGRIMDSSTQQFIHHTLRTMWGGGLALVGVPAGTGTGAVNADVQFAVSDGSIWDEDLQTVITAVPIAPQLQSLVFPAQIPIIAKFGNPTQFKLFPASTLPLVYGGRSSLDGEITAPGTKATYNLLTGSTWSLAEVSNNNFTLVHYVATNNIEYPIMGLMGINQYATKAAAQAGAQSELAAMNIYQYDALEMKAIGTVIYQTATSYANTPKSKIVVTDTGGSYVDWRTTANAGGSGGGSSVAIIDDTTTNATYYPTFSLSTTGSLTAVETSSTKLTYNPGLGVLTCTSIEYNKLNDVGYSYQTPTTGFSITIGADVTTLILDPAGTLATGTIIMPAAPRNGRIINLSSSQTITALTVSPNTGQSIKNAPTSLTVSTTSGQGYQYIYRAANTTWYRLK